MPRLSQATENFLRLIILGGFAHLFYRVITKGDLLQLIHPQFTYNAKLGWLIFVLLVIVQTIRLVDDMATPGCNAQKHIFAGCFYYIFIGALAICFLIPAKSLGSITAEQKGLKYLGDSSVIVEPALDGQAAVWPYGEKMPAGENAPKRSAVVNIDDTNHIRLITAIYEDTDRFIDSEVNLKGFVFRPDGLQANQFMVVRFEISCCAADAMPSGLIVESPDSLLYKNDTWVEVQGTIRQGRYGGVAVPLLQATKVLNIEPLSDPYVYTGNLVGPLWGDERHVE